jgi:hypothetical protein
MKKTKLLGNADSDRGYLDRRRLLKYVGAAAAVIGASALGLDYVMNPTSLQSQSSSDLANTTVADYDELIKTTSETLGKYDTDPHGSLDELTTEIPTFIQKLGIDRLAYHSRSLSIMQSQLSSLESQLTSIQSLTKRFQAPEPVKVNTKTNVAASYVTGWGMFPGRASTWTDGISIPVYGRYRADDSSVADWDIKYALEHGISTFLVDYTQAGSGHAQAFEAGLMHSRFFDKIGFAILYDVCCPTGSDYAQTQKTVSYVAQNYFSKANYLKIDGKHPVFWIYALQNIAEELGVEKTRKFVKDIRKIASTEGYDIFVVGDLMSMNHERADIDALTAEVDAITCFNLDRAGTDIQGNIVVYPYSAYVEGYLKEKKFWKQYAANQGKAFVPSSCPGFSNRALYESGVDNWLEEFTDATPEEFTKSCLYDLELVDPKVNLAFLDAWNEYGEKSVLAPLISTGFTTINAAREAYAIEPANGWPDDVLPGELY